MKTNALFDPPPPLQARGRPQEAEREVRALLVLIRENEAVAQRIPAPLDQVLSHAFRTIKMLDQSTGNQELVWLVYSELLKLRSTQTAILCDRH